VSGPPARLELVVLGAGPSYSTRPGSSGAAYLVRTAATALLLDLGQGSFPRLAAEIEPSRLDAVFVTHLHPDHYVDLVPLRHYLAYGCRPPARVRVIGPPGLADRLDALHLEPGFTASALDVEPHSTSSVVIGDLTLEARPVTHMPGSHAVRVAPVGGGPGLVYSGDCGNRDDLVPLIRAGDALLVEASFGVGPLPSGVTHLDAPAIAALVRSTQPGQVLLTHILDGTDPAGAVDLVAAATSAPVCEVHPGDRFDLLRGD
jgi:ribonuclease BN (tRNA processing enzyme)